MNSVAPVDDPPPPLAVSPSEANAIRTEKKVSTTKSDMVASASDNLDTNKLPSSPSLENREGPVIRRRVSAVRIMINDDGKTCGYIWSLLLHDKGMILFKAFVFVMGIQIFQTIMMFKDWGLVDLVAYGFGWNRFFALLIVARFCCFQIFTDAIVCWHDRSRPPLWKDLWKQIKFDLALWSCAIPLVLVLAWINIKITSSKNTSPMKTDKLFMTGLLYLTDVGSTFWAFMTTKIFLTDANKKKNIPKIVKRALAVATVPVFCYWSWFGIIIVTTVYGNSEEIDSTTRILLFGIIYPVFKAGVVFLCEAAARYLSRVKKLDEAGTKSQVVHWSAGAEVSLNIAQLYSIFQTSDNYLLFASQSIPQEIIEQFMNCLTHTVWFQTNVLFRCMNIVKKMGGLVDAIAITEEQKQEISVQMAVFQWEVAGREWGEDGSILLAGFASISISQIYLFYTRSDNLSGGSTHNVLFCLFILSLLPEQLFSVIGAYILRKYSKIVISHKSINLHNPFSVAIDCMAVTAIMMCLAAGEV